jgi:hypothetical protein
MPTNYPRYGGSDPKKQAADDRNWAYQTGGELMSDEEQARLKAEEEARQRMANADAFYSDPRNFEYTDDEKRKITRESELYTKMDSAYNPARSWGVSNASTRAQRGAVTQGQADMAGAIDANALKASKGYAEGLMSNWERTDDRMDEAANSDELGLSENFTSDYEMTPEQQQDIVTGAGISAGTGYRAAKDDLVRRSLAAGVDPLGVAAASSRLEREAAGEAGDAMTLARIGASDAAAKRIQTAEDMRLGAAQEQANQRMEAAEASGTLGLQSGSEWEHTRLGAEQDISDRKLSAAQTTAAQRIGTESEIAGRENDLENDTQKTKATNTLSVYDRLSGNYGKVADTRLGGQQNKVNYETGQQQMANQNANAAADRRVGVYGTTGELTNAATGNQIRNASRPSTWEKVAGLGIGAVGAVTGGGGIPGLGGGKSKGGGATGGVITEPTVAVLGEAGPEVVVPLTSRPNNRARTGMMRYGYGR